MFEFMTSHVKIVVRQGQQPIGKLEGPKSLRLAKVKIQKPLAVFNIINLSYIAL
jgi:hypothetical protein